MFPTWQNGWRNGDIIRIRDDARTWGVNIRTGKKIYYLWVDNHNVVWERYLGEGGQDVLAQTLPPPAPTERPGPPLPPSEVAKEERMRLKETSNALKKRLGKASILQQKGRSPHFWKMFGIEGSKEAINYLGVGYDVVKSFPLGEQGKKFDPGYKGAAIKVEFRQLSGTDSMAPVLGWARPKTSCNQQIRVAELTSMQELSDVMSVDANLDGDLKVIQGSGSYTSADIATKIVTNEQRVFIAQSTCVVEALGLNPFAEWPVTDAFQTGLDTLPRHENSTIKYVDFHTQCKSFEYRKFLKEGKTLPKHCSDQKKWVDFFHHYGTHIVHEVTLGGKIGHTYSSTNREIEDIASLTANTEIAVEADVKVASGSFNYDKDAEETSTAGAFNATVVHNTYSIGPSPPDVFQEQSVQAYLDEVTKNPMPIQCELTPMHHILKNRTFSINDNLRAWDMWHEGVLYYGRVLDKKVPGLHDRPPSKPVLRQIYEATPVITAAAVGTSLKCPMGTNIMFGFGFDVNFLLPRRDIHTYSIKECRPYMDECHIASTIPGTAVRLNPDYYGTRKWALCSPDTTSRSHQRYSNFGSEKNLEMTCPPGRKVLFGFTISLGACLCPPIVPPITTTPTPAPPPLKEEPAFAGELYQKFVPDFNKDVPWPQCLHGYDQRAFTMSYLELCGQKIQITPCETGRGRCVTGAPGYAQQSWGYASCYTPFEGMERLYTVASKMDAPSLHAEHKIKFTCENRGRPALYEASRGNQYQVEASPEVEAEMKESQSAYEEDRIMFGWHMDVTGNMTQGNPYFEPMKKGNKMFWNPGTHSVPHGKKVSTLMAALCISPIHKDYEDAGGFLPKDVTAEAVDALHQGGDKVTYDGFGTIQYIKPKLAQWEPTTTTPKPSSSTTPKP
eukprot:GHVQ01028719.1.p1 GENE.GHVQ01028719.1~~GHVQ01028719.1.p1  ORF type:complete len:948 (-),score=71.19 GHVQ01028719.1:27-2717(-)